jgi:MYXO-CTERM domain-containing protein
MSDATQDPLVAEIAAAVAEDGVWIDASRLGGQVDDAEEAALEQAVAGSDVPVTVIGLPLVYDGQYGGDIQQLGTLVRRESGDDAPPSMVYLGVTDDQGGVVVWTAGETTPVQDLRLAVAAEHLAPGDQGQQLLVAVELLNDPEALTAAYEEATADWDDVSSSGDGPPTPVVIGGLLLLAAVAAGVALRRRSARSRAGFRLPARVVQRVHSARAEELGSRADADVLALGEAIDAADMSAQADTTWQQVLDHYDAARRARDRSSGPADAVGAIVLADRGRQALEAAQHHHPYVPARRCFFDPLHGAAPRTATWTHDGRSVDVPACIACADALAEQRRPAVLELPVDGESRPWYESGVEPWVSTGYGALDTDLVAALTRHQGRSRH